MSDIAITPGNNATFDLYRYQLLVDKTVQMNLGDDYNSWEEIRASKNKLLEEILTHQDFHFHSKKANIQSKLLFQKEDRFYYKVAVKRDRKITHIDFTEGVVEDYPNILIAINNAPDVQKIAIQSYNNAFKTTEIVSRFMEQSIDRELQKRRLSMYVEPIIDEKEFWKLVSKYDKHITQLSFDMVSPNMANISQNLKINLKELYEDTNAHKTKIELTSDEDSYLEISQNNQLLNSLVDYTSQGGGNISLRIDGVRRKLHTAQTISEFSLNESLIKGLDWDKLDKAFKDILI